MPWNPKTDWAVNDVPTPTLLNDIGDSLTYLKEENKTIGGTNTFTGNMVISNYSPRISLTEIGSAYNWTLLSDSEHFYIGGQDAADYRLRISDDGRFVIPTGQVLIGTYTLDGTGNLLQVEGGASVQEITMPVSGDGIHTDDTDGRLVLAGDVNGSTAAGGANIVLRGSTSPTNAGVTEIREGSVIIAEFSEGAADITGSLTCTTIDTGNGATEIYDMNQDLRADDDVTFAGITSTGAINPTTTPTSGSWTGITTIPAGIYMVALIYGNSASYIESGTAVMFRVSSTVVSSGGTIISDGTLKAVQGGTSTITYKKY